MTTMLDDGALEQVARYFAALGATTRLKILNALREGERNVTELTRLTGATQANVSKHLALLAQQGLVDRIPRGTSAYYRIADPRIYRICEMVCGNIGAHLERLAGVEGAFSRPVGARERARARARRPAAAR